MIGVQNLIKKHQALQAELNGHEPRIDEVCHEGESMIEDKHFASKDIQERIDDLKSRWEVR